MVCSYQYFYYFASFFFGLFLFLFAVVLVCLLGPFSFHSIFLSSWSYLLDETGESDFIPHKTTDGNYPFFSLSLVRKCIIITLHILFEDPVILFPYFIRANSVAFCHYHRTTFY